MANGVNVLRKEEQQCKMNKAADLSLPALRTLSKKSGYWIVNGALHLTTFLFNCHQTLTEETLHGVISDHLHVSKLYFTMGLKKKFCSTTTFSQTLLIKLKPFLNKMDWMFLVSHLTLPNLHQAPSTSFHT